jgi:hypothetical protein
MGREGGSRWGCGGSFSLHWTLVGHVGHQACEQRSQFALPQMNRHRRNIGHLASKKRWPPLF